MEILEELWEEELQELEVQHTQMMELSFYLFLGIGSPTRHKLRGIIWKASMVVLIDSGATHNFITHELLRKAHLSTTKRLDIKVMFGSGITVNGLSVCEGVKINIQRLDSIINCIALELQKVDLVLGVQWLRTLGKCEVD